MSEGKPCAFDSNHKSHILKSILHYDSYLQFNQSLIECLWSNDNDLTEVPSEQLSKLTKIPTGEKMEVLGQKLVKLIEGQEKVSYRKLHEILGSFSIFCNRNPLVSDTCKLSNIVTTFHVLAILFSAISLSKAPRDVQRISMAAQS